MIHPNEGYLLYKSRRQRSIYDQHMYKHRHEYQRIRQEYQETQVAKERMVKALKKCACRLGDGFVALGRYLQTHGLAQPATQ